MHSFDPDLGDKVRAGFNLMAEHPMYDRRDLTWYSFDNRADQKFYLRRHSSLVLSLRCCRRIALSMHSFEVNLVDKVKMWAFMWR